MGPGAKPPAASSQTASGREPAPRLYLSTWPHLLDADTVPRIMYQVILALLPGALVGVYVFGMAALNVILLCVATCVATEWAIQRLSGRPVTVADGSAALTGLLLAMTLPPGVPWWISVIGGLTAMILGKHVYGGLGYNPFNPALVARVVLLISFPLQLTTWPVPGGTDGVTAATPLGILHDEGLHKLADFRLMDTVVGFVGGSLGETSALALLLGGAYLLYRRIITWHIPASFIGTVFAFSGIMHLVNPAEYASPWFHVLSGGLLLGAFFMATDMVTSPVTPRGQLIFGIGCGLLTIVIRLWGGYPEGVSFAIVIMNATVPILDKYITPRTYGRGA